MVVAISLVALGFIAGLNPVARAAPPNDYGVMCDACPAGSFSGVTVGTTVHGEAATDHTTAGGASNPVVQVRFRWIRPDSSVASDVLVTSTSSCTFLNNYVGNPAGTLTTSPPTACWHNSFAPDVAGEWGMQAIFCKAGLTCDIGAGSMSSESVVLAIRAVSFSAAVPEFPLGIASIIGLFAPILLLLRRRRLSSKAP